MTSQNLKDPKKRDFIVTSAGAMAGICGVAAVVPLVSSMNPAKDVQALASVEVDISDLTPGQEKKIMWRGKPVFIKRRTKEEIQEAQNVTMAELKDPETDAERVQKDEYLIVIGVCTHLGCVPMGKNSGEYDGWFCPCHGSHYDSSGRIRKGPAPKNLEVPQYSFLTDTTIKIG